jgi:perosamine synthetase
MEIIPHSRPTLDEEEISAVTAVLESGNVAQGERVAAFEEALASFIGVRGGVATSSGSAALHLSLLALEIGEGDEVIIPSFVCAALLNAVRHVRATPVPADISRETFNIDVQDIKRRLTKRTKAIIVPHMFGCSDDLREIISLGIPVVEDCAQSLGSSYEGARTGSFGLLSVFSFYATKVICTGEGGMVTSNDNLLLSEIRDLRDYDEKDDGALRYNCKLTDMQAAMGLTQLGKLPKMIARRREIAASYEHALCKYPISLPSCEDNRDHIYFRYVIRSSRAEDILASGEKNGFGYRRPVYKPLHRYLERASSEYPETEAVFREAVSIPIYPTLSQAEISFIISHLTRLIEQVDV